MRDKLYVMRQHKTRAYVLTVQLDIEVCIQNRLLSEELYMTVRS